MPTNANKSGSEPIDRLYFFDRVASVGRERINYSAGGRLHFRISTDNPWNRDGGGAGKQGVPHNQTWAQSRIEEGLRDNRGYGCNPAFDRFSSATTDSYFSWIILRSNSQNSDSMA